MTGQISDYRLYVVSVAGYFYPHNEMSIWVKVYKTKKAIAGKVHYPGTGRVRKYISFFNAALRNYEEVTLYWNGRELIGKAEYDFKLANLSKHRLKIQAERTRDETVKATVQDVLNFVRESRRNSANSNVKSNTKAGLTTSEGKELLDRCEGVK